jgi:hypothetical protein
MNNKANPERYGKLSVVSLITGILTPSCGPCLFFTLLVTVFVDLEKERTVIQFSNLPYLPKYIVILFFYMICLPVTAAVCGSIDLIKIREGKSSNIGKAFDIFGIAIGSVFLIVTLLIIILLSMGL